MLPTVELTGYGLGLNVRPILLLFLDTRPYKLTLSGLWIAGIGHQAGLEGARGQEKECGREDARFGLDGSGVGSDGPRWCALSREGPSNPPLSPSLVSRLSPPPFPRPPFSISPGLACTSGRIDLERLKRDYALIPPPPLPPPLTFSCRSPPFPGSIPPPLG